ncbi:hypothetical protein EDB83DRAFT_420818 [Lactarius deliciosus]|nr:hypothetical protein EDB83DRAFT_420818 [Lactarius deliciosus]
MLQACSFRTIILIPYHCNRLTCSQSNVPKPPVGSRCSNRSEILWPTTFVARTCQRRYCSPLTRPRGYSACRPQACLASSCSTAAPVLKPAALFSALGGALNVLALVLVPPMWTSRTCGWLLGTLGNTGAELELLKLSLQMGSRYKCAVQAGRLAVLERAG